MRVATKALHVAFRHLPVPAAHAQAGLGYVRGHRFGVAARLGLVYVLQLHEAHRVGRHVRQRAAEGESPRTLVFDELLEGVCQQPEVRTRFGDLEALGVGEYLPDVVRDRAGHQGRVDVLGRLVKVLLDFRHALCAFSDPGQDQLLERLLLFPRARRDAIVTSLPQLQVLVQDDDVGRVRVILLVEFVDVDRVGEVAQLRERLVQSQVVVGVVGV